MKYHTVHVEGTYQHYKNKKHYHVIEVGTHTETGEHFVVYFCLDDIGYMGSKKVWIRPKAMFEEGLEIDGKIVPRFKYLDNLHECSRCEELFEDIIVTSNGYNVCHDCWIDGEDRE